MKNNSLWACLCAGDILLKREGTALSLPMGAEPPVEVKPWQLVTTLENVALPAANASAANMAAANVAAVPDGSPSGCSLHVVRLSAPVTGVPSLEMMPLRASFDVLSPAEYALAGKAAELIYWDANTRFCGCCGTPMRLHTEISKRCTECGKEVWPQLATAVIVRVTRTHPEGRGGSSSSVLLVRSRSFRRPYYGLVAGFVETGETLEEAVRREVREETGLEITDLRYFGSQPWPFPCGLMVGFTARYASGELRLQRSELADGGWFTRETLPAIPGPASIARRLIDEWVRGAE